MYRHLNSLFGITTVQLVSLDNCTNSFKWPLTCLANFARICRGEWGKGITATFAISPLVTTLLAEDDTFKESRIRGTERTIMTALKVINVATHSETIATRVSMIVG